MSRVEQQEGHPGADQTRHLVLVTQAIFFASVALCWLLVHTTKVEDEGISYYGVHLRTLFVIGIGYVASAAGLWRMGWRFRSGGAPSEVVISLRLIAIGLVGLLLTPFSIGGVVNWAHMGFGVMIALTQFWLTAMLLERRHSIAGVVGASLQLGGGVMAALSLPDWSFVYLFQGEVLMEIGFSVCLVQWVYALGQHGEW